ncbi:MAG: sulfatase-like hydrolase/transferase [Acidobacteriota bacterium]|nr:sulfatase-like hydrolase/transferase [Acidobacteriota bacterium]
MLQPHTPNIDRLAREGKRFTNAPMCAPSRSGLITGMYPRRPRARIKCARS